MQYNSYNYLVIAVMIAYSCDMSEVLNHNMHHTEIMLQFINY